MTKERMDELQKLVSDILYDTADLDLVMANYGLEGYRKRIDDIAHFVVYSMIGDMANAGEI